MISLLLIFLLCVLLSAVFSGSEMALVSASEFQIHERADAGDKAAKKILPLKQNPETFLTSLLIGNNIVNITATAIITYIFQVYFGISSEWLVTAIMVPVLIVFAEMVPKDYCRFYGYSILMHYTPFFLMFNRLMRWPSSVLLHLIHGTLDVFGIGRDKNIFVSEKEFRLLIEEGTRTGIVEHHEKQLIDMILDFERIRVESVLIPLDQVPQAALGSTVAEVKQLARETGSSMVLIYEEIPSLVVGMVYVFDLLFEEDESKGLREFLRSPVFLSNSTSLEKAFLTLQQKRQSYAVVTDPRQEVLGVVPIERLLASTPTEKQ